MATRAIDLRSDTVTRPTPEMAAAMARAEVGDDVFGEDPTVTLLERRLAEILGKESAVFVPSGTMSNQIGVRVHCRPGDELICEAQCHIFRYEQGGYAQLSGVVACPVEGDSGLMRLEQLTGLLRKDDPHLPRSRLLCLENTHNRGGGRVWPVESLAEICTWAHDAGLATHLDGARLMNAVVASGIEAHRYASHFDTVSICFSKGLGAPVGSALAGSAELIYHARRVRKLFGGGMRQAGVIAAGALYALENHVERLAEDHEHARLLAATIDQIEGLDLVPATVDTNIVIFRVDPAIGTPDELVTRLAARGVQMLSIAAGEIRAVTHLDVNREEIEQACQALREMAVPGAQTPRPSGARTSYA